MAIKGRVPCPLIFIPRKKFGYFFSVISKCDRQTKANNINIADSQQTKRVLHTLLIVYSIMAVYTTLLGKDRLNKWAVIDGTFWKFWVPCFATLKRTNRRVAIWK
jgi:hypothetical protein